MEPRRMISRFIPSQRTLSSNGSLIPNTSSSSSIPTHSIVTPPVVDAPPASAPIDQVPKSARRKHSKVVASQVSNEEDSSERPRKNVRGTCRMIKSERIVNTSKRKIKVTYDERFRGDEKSQVHSLLTHDIGAIVRMQCPMNKASFSDLSDDSKSDLRDFLTVHFDIDYDHMPTALYIDEIFKERFRQWKHDCHKHFQVFESPQEAKDSPPIEFVQPPVRKTYWHWLCDHFMSPDFQKKSAANKKNRDEKLLNHHGGAKLFVYHIEDIIEKTGSKFPAVDNFKNVYVTPDNPIAAPLYEKMLEKINEFNNDNETHTSDTSMEDIPPIDPLIGVNILTETLKELGPSAGSYVRGMGRGMIRDVKRRLSSSTSQSSLYSSDKVTKLEEELGHSRDEVKGLKEELATQASMFSQLLEVLKANGIASLENIVAPSTTTEKDSTPNLS